MPDPFYDQRGQSAEWQLNAGRDVNYQAAPPHPPPGRILGAWPGHAAFFTGREEVLHALHAALGGGNAAVTPPPQALNGMPGVGKTTVAAQYVASRWDCFRLVAWLPAQRVEGLEAALAELGPSLSPPIPATGDAKTDYEAARRWFAAHPGWLIVADNVEDWRAVRGALPPTATGRVLMTTRREDPGGGAVAVRVERMRPETGATFLLRRAGRLGADAPLADASREWREGALALSRRFDGLPLALAQAGAYVASRRTTPARYLERFDAERVRLMDDAGDLDHATVTATFSLALEAVEAIETYGPAAAQLVRLCAFLAPDPIPDEAFLGNAKAIEEPLQAYVADEASWDETVEAATRFALLERDPDGRTLSLHRLVADVVRDGMDDDARRAGTLAAVRAVNMAFPDGEYGTWDVCARLLPHALLLREAVKDEEIVHTRASRMLDRTASYLEQRGRYSEAEPIFREALAMRRALHGDDHPNVAAALNNLGLLLRNMGRYDEATAALEEAVAIDGWLPEADDLDVAAHLDNLGGVHLALRRYAEAETGFRRALELREKRLGPDHPDVSIHLNNLALALGEQGAFGEALELRERDLRVKRATLGEGHPEYATSLVNLGTLYVRAGRLDEAAGPLEEAMRLRDAIHAGAHPECAGPRFWLGQLHYARDELQPARALMAEALAIRERHLPPDHPETAGTRGWVAGIDAEIAAGGEEAGGGGSGGTGDGARR